MDGTCDDTYDNPLPGVDTITVVDVEYLDGDRYSYVFDASGDLTAWWPRDHDALTESIRTVPAVQAISDPSLVDGVADATFRDGSTPFRLLAIPHRFVEALERCGAPKVRDLQDVADQFEILDISSWPVTAD